MAEEKVISHDQIEQDLSQLQYNELLPESLPGSVHSSVSSLYNDEDGVMTDERLEQLLIKRISEGDAAAKFHLGQFYFEREMYDKAFSEFDKIKDHDIQAIYQLGVMYYDGLGVEEDAKKGFEIMKSLCENKSKDVEYILPFAQYNIGRAYYEGKGVLHSDKIAEEYWLKAAKDGDPGGSIKAQSILGLFYSRPSEATHDLKKSYYWHQEACGNGNIESQGALGVMFEYGIGVERHVESAFICLKGASKRGNVYAQGNLAMHFYRQKLYNQACEIARNVGLLNDVYKIASVTDCLAMYVAKGIAIGCYVYGLCHRRGHGLEKNEKEAVKWFRRCYQFDPETLARFHGDMAYGYL